LGLKGAALAADGLMGAKKMRPRALDEGGMEKFWFPDEN
jgi:hypothetical protein